MNHVERFRAAMNFQPVDRLPRWEWAMWWDETVARWQRRPPDATRVSLEQYRCYLRLLEEYTWNL